MYSKATHTIGSSEFFWNCTSLTRVMFSISEVSGESGSILPFKKGVIGGGGVTLTASSP